MSEYLYLLCSLFVFVLGWFVGLFSCRGRLLFRYVSGDIKHVTTSTVYVWRGVHFRCAFGCARECVYSDMISIDCADRSTNEKKSVFRGL